MRSINVLGASPPCSSSSKGFRITNISIFLVSLLLVCPGVASGFVPPFSGLISTSKLLAAETQDEEVARQLKRAKEVLAKTKAKIEAKAKYVEELEIDSEVPKRNSNIPFFASQAAKKNGDKKDKVIKSKNENGLFTTDGALMAELSEAEEWEARPLLDVFENENKTTKTNDSLADRDVAASIFGLQRVLQTEDFQKIFDKRNRFIGEQ
jgi:hypothetical protein